MRLTVCLITGTLLVAATSCTVQRRYLHNAAPALIPMLKEKSEGYASAYYHSNGKEENVSSGNGVNVQAGYAFAKNFGVIGGYNNISHKAQYTGFEADPFELSNIGYRRKETTLAVNFFTLSDRKNTAFNFLLGATTGKLKIDDQGQYMSAPYQRHFYSNHFSVFLQPGLNLYPSKIVSIGFAPKLSYVSYAKGNTTYTKDELTRFGLNNISPFMYSEFGLKFSFGPENIPLTLDMQGNFIVNAPADYHLRDESYSIGVTYRFNTARKKN